MHYVKCLRTCKNILLHILFAIDMHNIWLRRIFTYYYIEHKN